MKLRAEHVGRRVACLRCRKPLRVVSADGVERGASLADAIVVRKGPTGIGEQMFLAGSGPIEIGKLPDKPIRLDGSLVSRTHCLLQRESGGWRIIDQKSRNGLRINGRPAARRELQPNDVIGIGEYELVFVQTSGRAAPAAVPAVPAPEPADEEAENDLIYRLVDEARSAPAVETEAQPAGPREAGPTCPSCKRELGRNAKICVQCGVDLRTGRSIVLAQEDGLDNVYATSEGLIRLVSWVIPLGVYPIASEAYGKRKPWAIRAIALLTIFITVWFWAYEWSGSPRMASLKNLMLWVGEAEPDPMLLAFLYEESTYGNPAAFEAKYYELGDTIPEEQRLVAAHSSLGPEDRCLGTYRPSQLITHAFLHGGILHLLSNLLFLMVFGSRVNALLGSLGAAVVYPLLAVAGGLRYLWTSTEQMPHPMLGASGAIMGLAGMYLVLFPANKVHVGAWARWGFIAGFHLSLRMFAVRGFWVVAFYIAFDILYTSLGVETGTAHWAHLGGFIAGMGLGLVLLLSRLVNARGGDLLSVLLGRYAWPLVGRPDPQRKAILGG